MAEFIIDTEQKVTPLQHAESIFKSYILKTFFSTMMGTQGSGKPIILDSKLFKGKMAGDVGRYHFIPQNFSDGIEGQNASIIGNEDTLEEYFMDLRIDQVAKAFAKKGKMTDIRMIWNFRDEAKTQMTEWFKWRTENDIIAALTGLTQDGCTKLKADVVNTAPLVNGNGRCIRVDYASNKFSSELVAGSATSTNSLLGAVTQADVFNTSMLDELQVFAKTANEKYAMRPIRCKDNEEYYILVLHPKAAMDLRKDKRWEARALANYTGKGSLESDPIATGAIGIWNKIIVKEAEYIKTHQAEDKSVQIARNLLLGAESAVMAYAQELDYSEELIDHKRKMSVASDEIRGVKKICFDNTDLNLAQVISAIQ